MSALAAIRRANAAGISLFLRRDGAVEAAPAPAADLLADLREHKAGIAALLATAARSADLPTCPGCRGQRFWRDTSGASVGDWTCAGAPIPEAVREVDILGPIRGEPSIVMLCSPREVSDPEALARLLISLGTYIALGRIKPREWR